MRRTVLGAACLVALAGGALSMGACGSDPIVLTVMAPDDPVSPDGKSAAKIEVRVTKGGSSVNTGNLTFSSSLDGSQFDAPIEDLTELPGPDAQTTETSLSAGAAAVRLYSIAKGTAKIAITFMDDETGTTASATKSVVFGGGSETKVSAIKFISADPPDLQLKDSGGQTTSQITFQVLDSANSPVRDAEIDFELGSDLGGASLDPTSAKTGDNGMVVTTLSAGTTYGSVKVKAYTKDRSISGESDSITIAGSAANYKHFDFGCDRGAIGGFAWSGLTMNCTARVADRSSQKIPGVQVTFEAEAGSINRYVTTGAEDEEEGAATSLYTTQLPNPVDVDPNIAYLPPWMGTGQEPSQPCPCREQPSRLCTCNPRDGLVTIIAVTSGEEEWTDRNENGAWDDNESFVDLPEPFVDANDNGKFDPTDPREADLYIDANKNGKWDDKNGRWDGSTQIWRSVKIVWTGHSDAHLSGIYDVNTNTKINSVSVAHCGQSPVEVLVIDQNFNRLTSQAGDQMSCECPGGLCESRPDSRELGDGGGGNNSIGPFNIADAHDCASCSAESPCVPGVDSVICSATFTQSQDASQVINWDATISAPVQ